MLQLREQKSKPVLEQFKAWVEELLPGTPPNSALGKALAYTTRQWPKLTRHLQHAEIPVGRVDDWRGKRTLRGVAVNRRCRCLSPRRKSLFQSRSSNRTCGVTASGSHT